MNRRQHRGASTLAGLFLFLLAVPPPVSAARPFEHDWSTVGALMSMHGKYKTPPTQADIEFVARTYATITTGTSCSTTVNTTHTIEEDVLAVAARIKTANPAALVGMYWRTDFALELADCSGFAAEWAAHPEWRLKDDAGRVITKSGHFYIDYLNPAAAAFFARVVVNVTTAMLAVSSDPAATAKPVLDFVYLDGDPTPGAAIRPGIGPARSAQLVDAIYACFASIQQQLDQHGYDQKVVLNGMDDAAGAAYHVRTGAAASMFDHWSILQFLNRTSGDFNVTLMASAIDLANSSLLANVTTQIKGWPGPIVRQRDIYPPAIPGPKTPAEFQAVIAQRFNSELALFLLVADRFDFWIYSWFWGWDDYVPGHPDSTIPAAYFPEARCPLGAPTAPAQRASGSWTYTRTFEHASVFVDLNNRTASKVTFTNCN